MTRRNATRGSSAAQPMNTTGRKKRRRNRNIADGLLLIPTSWARNNYTILETINLINVKTSAIYFDGLYSFSSSEKNSILQGKNIVSFSGEPASSCIKGIKHLIDK